MSRIVSLKDARQQKTTQTVEEWKADVDEAFKQHPEDKPRTILGLEQLHAMLKVWEGNVEAILLRMLAPRLEVSDHYTSIVISIQDVIIGWVPVIELHYTTAHQNLIAGDKLIIDEAFQQAIATNLRRHQYPNRLYAVIESMVDTCAGIASQYRELELLKWEDTDDTLTIEFRGTTAELDFNHHVLRFHRKRLYEHFENCKRYRQEHHLDNRSDVVTFTLDK